MVQQASRARRSKDDRRVPATTFAKFSKLPLELRHDIWKLVAHLPRNIDIWPVEIAQVSYNDGTEHDYIYKNTTTQNPPGMLLANRESRSVGLRYYRKGLAGHSNIAGFNVISKTQIWFNVAVDRVCSMGSYGPEAEVNIWKTAASSLALNVATAIMDPETINAYARRVWAGGYKNEYDGFLLYCCYNIPKKLGNFEFVDITANSKYTIHIWKKLVETERVIKQAILESWEEEEIDEYDSDDPDCELRQPGEHLMRMPIIKIVKLVVGGVPQI